jgi:uncharacterized protein YijF (DUF1287 family)
MTTRRSLLLGFSALTLTSGVTALYARPQWKQAIGSWLVAPVAAQPAPVQNPFAPTEPWAAKLVNAAEGQIGRTLTYDPAYTQLSYPGGDVPIQKGVCTDVVIRAYRKGLGTDLQQAVHEDMRANFPAYPKKWGLKRPDRNIDHRRVPNLMTFFKRRGASLPVTDEGQDYLPGDVVTMNLPGNLTHIVLVTNRPSADGLRPLCVHNIGAGARLEDTLFAFEITGHYRWNPVAA